MRGPAPPQELARASGEALGRTREARVHARDLVGTRQVLPFSEDGRDQAGGEGIR